MHFPFGDAFFYKQVICSIFFEIYTIPYKALYKKRNDIIIFSCTFGCSFFYLPE